MYAPSRYDHVYPFSYLYTYFVSVPHSILIQLAAPTANKTYGESLMVWLTLSTLRAFFYAVKHSVWLLLNEVSMN